MAMAEESPAFVAQNAARAASFDQARTELATRPDNDAKPQQTQAKHSISDESEDS